MVPRNFLSCITVVRTLAEMHVADNRVPGCDRDGARPQQHVYAEDGIWMAMCWEGVWVSMELRWALSEVSWWH